MPTTIIDRYELHGLTGNPFAAEVSADEAQALFVDRYLPDPPSPRSSTFVQVIGDRGAGKTTQVQAWRRRIGGPYHYVPATPIRQRWATAPVAALVYADEIDRMPVLLRRHWFRRLGRVAATVVAGTHVDLESVARRAGFAVVTHRLGPANLNTVRAVIEQRLRAVAITGGARPLRLSEAEIAEIHRRSNGSLRAVELLGHELVAARVLGSPISRSPKGRGPSDTKVARL